MGIIDTEKLRRRAIYKAEYKQRVRNAKKAAVKQKDQIIKTLVTQLEAVGVAPQFKKAPRPDEKPGTLKTKRRNSARKDFYKSQAWLELRYEAFKLHGAACQCCGATRRDKTIDGRPVILHVDHRKPRSLFPELELDINNTQIMCESCNLGKSNHDMIDWR